jgi:hypothetical protein
MPRLILIGKVRIAVDKYSLGSSYVCLQLERGELDSDLESIRRQRSPESAKVTAQSGSLHVMLACDH